MTDDSGKTPGSSRDSERPWFDDAAFALTPGPSWNEIARWIFVDAGTVKDIRARYEETKEAHLRLSAVPAEARLLAKIACPLRAAWVDYLLGNYLATITLCGLTGEMVASLVYDMSVVHKANRATLVAKFDKCPQAKRLNLLAYKCKPKKRRRFGLQSAQALLTEPRYRALRDIHDTRITYYHHWSRNHNDVRRDAKRLYTEAVEVVRSVIGQDWRQGKLRLTPEIVPYLRVHGCLKPPTAD